MPASSCCDCPVQAQQGSRGLPSLQAQRAPGTPALVALAQACGGGAGVCSAASVTRYADHPGAQQPAINARTSEVCPTVSLSSFHTATCLIPSSGVTGWDQRGFIFAFRGASLCRLLQLPMQKERGRQEGRR